MGLSVEKSLKHTPYPYRKENIYIKKFTNTRLIPNASTTFVRVTPSHLYQKNKQKKLYINDFNLYQKLFINPGTNLYQGTNPGTTVCTRPAQYKKKNSGNPMLYHLNKVPFKKTCFLSFLKKYHYCIPQIPILRQLFVFEKNCVAKFLQKRFEKRNLKGNFKADLSTAKKKTF